MAPRLLFTIAFQKVVIVWFVPSTGFTVVLNQPLQRHTRSSSDHTTPRPAFFLATGNAAATELAARLS